MFFTNVYNWTSFCGPGGFFIWDSSYHDFGLCFQKLSFKSFFIVILSLCSLYYIGKYDLTGTRRTKWKTLLWIRFLTSCCSLLLSVLEISLYYFLLHYPIYWVDILSFTVEICGWMTHLWFIKKFMSGLTRGTRGPNSVIIAWFLCFLYYICNCRSSWISEIHIDNTGALITTTISTLYVVLQAIYFITLIPRGLDDFYLHLRDASQSYEDHLLHLGTAEKGVNWISFLLFHWVNALMKKGKKGNLLDVNDVYHLPDSLQSDFVFDKFGINILQAHKPTISSIDLEDDIEVAYDELNERNHILLKFLYQSFKVKFYALGFLKFLADGLNFVGPLMLYNLVSYVSDEEKNHWNGYTSAIVLCFASVIGAFCSVHYNYLLTKLNIQLRSSLVTSVFQKIQSLNLSKLAKFSSGEIVNFMSTDVDRIMNLCESFHASWSLPIQLAFILYLLYKQIGVAFLVGVGISLLMLPINRIIAVKIGKYSERMMHFKDKRVNLTTEALSFIKTIKLNCWENLFKRKISDERYVEMKALSGRKYLDAGCVYFWATLPVLIPIITFCTYAALGNTLKPAEIFTSLALFNMLTVPLNALPWVINGLVEAFVSIKRIEKLLKVREKDLEEYYEPFFDDASQEKTEIKLRDIGFKWKECCAREHEETTDEEEDFDENASQPILLSHDYGRSHPTSRPYSRRRQPCADPSQSIDKFFLRHLTTFVNKGMKVGIVGSVGCGKTTLLYGILAELKKTFGSLHMSDRCKELGFGFVPEEPWLQNKAIIDNIIFGNDYNPKRYSSVVFSCALEEDFASLPNGDRTLCGENGASLSNGQRVRVSLARALYQDKPAYLMDDILAAVDVPVAEHIMMHCFSNLLFDKTVIMVSHHANFLTRFDWIIEIGKGKIVRQGLPKFILPMVFKTSFSNKELQNYSHNDKDDKDLQEVAVGNNVPESRSFGNLNFSVYKTYFSAVGGLLAFMIFMSMLLMQATKNFADIWLAKWVSVPSEFNSSYVDGSNWNEERISIINKQSSYNRLMHFGYMFNAPQTYFMFSSFDNEYSAIDPTNKFYICIYAIIAAVNSGFAFLRSFLFAYGGIVAAKKIHSKLLNTVLGASTEFFTRNPLGRILNRFSTDTYAIDDRLPFEMNILLKQVFELSGSLVVSLYGLPWIFLLYMPLMVLYHFIQQFYRHASRDLRRIYALSLSPLYNHFIETIKGLPVIRANRSQGQFFDQLKHYLNNNQQAKFCMELASQWLNLRLQLIGICIIVGVVLLSLYQDHLAQISPGIVGLVISYALTVNGLLNGVVVFFTRTEQELISMERLKQYLDETSEGETLTTVEEYRNPPPEWPDEGNISFHDFSMRYQENLDCSLKNINLDISSCDKIGIIGRTGAGKSSLFMSLFRMVPFVEGKIFIDGIDISTISVKRLRTRMAIVSQDVPLFSGSIKENLDPKGVCLESEVERAIHLCYLTRLVSELGGLLAPVKNMGQDFSAGQRQLFCIARALLSKAKIICIDEGTAFLDFEMDSKIQSVMKKVFKHKTLLIIAHRLQTVKDCDRVVTIEDGKIVRICKPSELQGMEKYL